MARLLGQYSTPAKWRGLLRFEGPFRSVSNPTRPPQRSLWVEEVVHK